MAFCEKKNISSRRIQFAYHSNNTFEHMNFYNKVDIALDTFPYNGTTTTCDALWMGVPVISLFGNEHRSRVGLSLLTNAGMTDWAASSCEMMIEIARTAVSNLESLDTLRQNLRNKLSDSPLMDSKLLTSNIEQLYESVYDNTTT